MRKPVQKSFAILEYSILIFLITAFEICSPSDSCFFGEIRTQFLQMALVRPWANPKSAKMQKDAKIPRIFMLCAQRGRTMVPKYHRWLALWRLARLTRQLSVPGLKCNITHDFEIFRSDFSTGKSPRYAEKFARRWEMKSVGVALEFAIGVLPAFLKAISPMAFALVLRIGSPGGHENSTVQQEISLYKGKWNWPGTFDNNVPKT